MFSRLRVKLTVLYAALFGAGLILVSLAVYTAISANAQSQVRNELTASGTVFDRVWSLRSDQLRQGAALLSKDFGFREAMATGDEATIVSAMENLRDRFGIDLAFIIGVDGHVAAAEPGLVAPRAADILKAMNEADDPSGVLILGGAPYQVISAPVLTPDLIGWVVFAARLDAREMSSLEKLSAIPLDAAVMHRGSGGWTSDLLAKGKDKDRLAISGFVEEALAAGAPRPRLLDTAEGRSVALVKPLKSLTGSDASVLILRYPLALALAPYRGLLATIAGVGLLGLIFVICGSWALARSVTRPISALDQAAQRLREGHEAQVAIETRDEIGRLAESFNTMATEIRERERRITHQALHDDETGLPNRMGLELALAELKPAGFMAALGVDRFDHVRGAIGYEFAAELIRGIGARLSAHEPEARLARLSTEVLGVVIPAADEGQARERVTRLLAMLEQPLRVGGDVIDVALTAGLAPLAEGAAMERANIALDQARSTRRKIALFDAEAYGDPSSNLALMSGMLAAIEAGEIDLFHQPKYDVRQGRIGGVEGLVRWRHPTRGMLSPDLFIPMAEETGHIRALTDWVLERAIADRAVMAAAGRELEVSVNISGRLLGDRDFADHAIDTVGRSAGGICFEITETAVIDNPKLALEILDRFAAAGIAVSIDDFGTGLSSLAYLKQIRGSELKIDKSLIVGVAQSQRDALIVKSTVDLAHSLGLKVTAEGVETHDVYAILAAMGCDNIQGYLIARPQPLRDLMEFLDRPELTLARYG